MATFRVGESIEAVTFLRPNGESVSLEEFGKGAKLLVFLRHLA